MTSIARAPPSFRRPQSKTKCQQDPNSIACKEEKLSKIRSQTAVWDLSASSKAGQEIASLQADIKKNERLN